MTRAFSTLSAMCFQFYFIIITIFICHDSHVAESMLKHHKPCFLFAAQVSRWSINRARPVYSSSKKQKCARSPSRRHRRAAPLENPRDTARLVIPWLLKSFHSCTVFIPVLAQSRPTWRQPSARRREAERPGAVPSQAGVQPLDSRAAAAAAPWRQIPPLALRGATQMASDWK